MWNFMGFSVIKILPLQFTVSEPSTTNDMISKNRPVTGLYLSVEGRYNYVRHNYTSE